MKSVGVLEMPIICGRNFLSFMISLYPRQILGDATLPCFLVYFVNGIMVEV